MMCRVIPRPPRVDDIRDVTFRGERTMNFRFFGQSGLSAIVLSCVILPGNSHAQVFIGGGIGPPGFGNDPYRYPYYGPGPWAYPGLPAGPYLGYAYPYSWWWGFPGAAGATWTNGLHLAGPPVPMYGPLPGVLGASDLNHQWRANPSLAWGYGWVGVYGASPRPQPLTVNNWSANDPRGYGQGWKHGRQASNGIIVERVPGPVAAPAQSAGSLVISVRVPQPAAEVFVDGVRMTQTGTDRLFESPPLEAGQTYQYEVTARWIEGGTMREVKKTATGNAGEVVRVEFP